MLARVRSYIIQVRLRWKSASTDSMSLIVTGFPRIILYMGATKKTGSGREPSNPAECGRPVIRR